MKVFKTLAVAAALCAFGPAQAASVIYNVTGNFVVGATAAGTLSGSFTIDNVTNQVTAVNLTTSGVTVGGFTYALMNYTNVANVTVQSLPAFFQLDVAGTNSRQLRLIFSGGLTATGAPLSTSSYENQSQAGNRTISTGAATAQVRSPVPEPATWAMMLAGFGALGFALRRRPRVEARIHFA